MAPHLPLLHQALLQEPACDPPGGPRRAPGGDGAVPRVGAARVQVAALLAALARSELADVCSTMLTLGTLPAIAIAPRTIEAKLSNGPKRSSIPENDVISSVFNTR